MDDDDNLIMRRIGKRKWRLFVDGKPTGPELSYEAARPYLLGIADRRELLPPNYQNRGLRNK